jgi:hypothetical protein
MVALAAATPSCGLTNPSESLAGNWSANHGGKFGFIGLVLEQSGDEITGTACATDSGITLYRNVPVRGEYPRVQFDVAGAYTEPCCAQLAGVRFSGRRDSTRDIVGVYGNTDVRFRRSQSRVCP